MAVHFELECIAHPYPFDLATQVESKVGLKASLEIGSKWLLGFCL